MSQHIVMLVKNTFTNDARVLREAKSLTASGFSISIVALSGNNLPVHEVVDGINVYRVKRAVNIVRQIGDPKTGSTPKPSPLVVRQAKRVIWHIARVGSQLPIAQFIHTIQDNRMVTQARTLNPDVIYAHDLDTLAAGVQIKTDCHIPLVYDSHEMASGRTLSSAGVQQRALKLERELIKQADLVIMASGGYADKAVQLYGVARPTVVRNIPVKPDSIDSAKNLRTQFSIPTEALVLVHQGSIQPHRGLEQAIEAIAELPLCHIVIIGYGSHLMAIRQLVSQLGLDSRVHFLGTVPAADLIDWSASADLGLCTIVGASESYKHSMPNKLFEYMMSGIAVLASDYPGMGSFTTENNIGLTCDPESVSAIRQAIQKFIDAPELLHECAANSKKCREIVNWQSEEKVLQSAVSGLFTE